MLLNSFHQHAHIWRRVIRRVAISYRKRKASKRPRSAALAYPHYAEAVHNKYVHDCILKTVWSELIGMPCCCWANNICKHPANIASTCCMQENLRLIITLRNLNGSLTPRRYEYCLYRLGPMQPQIFVLDVCDIRSLLFTSRCHDNPVWLKLYACKSSLENNALTITENPST